MPTAAGWAVALAPGSDLDVGHDLIGFRRGRRLTLREELSLEAELADAVGADVDLRDLADSPLSLGGRVLEDGIRVYSGDDVERVALERDLLARYHDYKDVSASSTSSGCASSRRAASEHGRQAEAGPASAASTSPTTSSPPRATGSRRTTRTASWC
jgi:hypothetical protein